MRLQYATMEKVTGAFIVLTLVILVFTATIVGRGKNWFRKHVTYYTTFEEGYNLVSGGTDNHLMLIDLRNKGLTGKQAEEALGRAEITVNKNMVPFDDKSPFVTSGIRIGTPALTTRGFGASEFEHVVDLVDRVLADVDDEDTATVVRSEVRDLCRQFPLYDFVVA